MDSRLIYKATQHLTGVVNWEKEWKYLGTDEEINFNHLKNLIDEHLNESEILFVQGRTNSRQIKREIIIEEIRPFLSNSDFQLWTLSMNKVIRFSKIGVIRFGTNN